MFVPAFRALVKIFIFKPGEGASKEDSAKEHIEFRGVATPDLQSDNKQAFVKAWYSGSMYYCKCTSYVYGVYPAHSD
jgi:hypothetical protein